MLAENVFGSAHRRGSTLQVLPENMFRRTRLSCDFGEANKGRLGEPAAANGINGDALVFRATLENHGVEVLDSPRQFRGPAQGIVQLLNFLVHRRSALEIELFTGRFTLLLQRVA